MKAVASSERGRLGTYLLIPGLVLLAVAGYFAFREARFHAVAQSAVGKFTDEGGSPVGEDKIMFTYFVTYKAREGGSYQFVESGVSEQLPEGKPLNVLYDPSDPKNARLTTRDGWFLPRSIGPAGLLFTGLGVFLLRPRRRGVSLPAETPTTV